MSNFKGKQNRTMGHNGERFYARVFRAIGFDKCKTSRQASRLHDDSKIDLVFNELNIQIKTGIQKGMSPREELRLMSEKIVENFPETETVHKYPKLVIHRRTINKGARRTEFDDMVSMTFKDFVKVLSNDYTITEYENYNKL